MRASLLGVELRGSIARLTVVDRSGVVTASTEEPLDGSVAEWWRVHPEERFRGVLALLEKGLREGLLQGGQVAAIGLSCDPGLTLLDRDFKAIPPREIPWDTIFEEEERTPEVALRRLGEVEGRWARHVGVAFGVLDYVRFRLTGALAVHEGFAFGTGLTQQGRSRNWDVDKLERTGIAADAFPPVFSAGSKVSVVSEEVVERTGISHGIWINSGCTPLSGDLFLAAESKPGTRILRVDSASGRGAELWQLTTLPSDETPPGGPDAWTPGLAEEGAWYQRLEAAPEVGLSELASLPKRWWETPVFLDYREGSPPAQLPGEVRVPSGSAKPSAAAAVGAGLALGWWRDPRTLWRKARASHSYEAWCQKQASAPAADAQG